MAQRPARNRVRERIRSSKAARFYRGEDQEAPAARFYRGKDQEAPAARFYREEHQEVPAARFYQVTTTTDGPDRRSCPKS